MVKKKEAVSLRVVWVAIYLFLLLKNPATSLMFSIGLGLSGDATVSPTSGIVNYKCGVKRRENSLYSDSSSTSEKNKINSKIKCTL